MKNYEEIIDGLELERVNVAHIEEKEDHDVITIYGGLNGRGDILYYLDQVERIICELQGHCKDVWLVSWTNDCLDDVWYLNLGVSHEWI